MILPDELTPAPKDDGLQALREVGSEEKTQYWDRDDIMQALRRARLTGVRVDSLYAHKPISHTSRMHTVAKTAR